MIGFLLLIVFVAAAASWLGAWAGTRGRSVVNVGDLEGEKRARRIAGELHDAAARRARA